MRAEVQIIKHASDPSSHVSGQNPENDMEENADQQSNQEGDNLILRYAARKDADGNVGCRHQDKTQIACPNSSMIQRSKRGNRDVVGQGESQGNTYKDQGG